MLLYQEGSRHQKTDQTGRVEIHMLGKNSGFAYGKIIEEGFGQRKEMSVFQARMKGNRVQNS